MMIAEQELFIRLLRDYVHQDISIEPDGEIDWMKIVRYAAEQDLSGIIYYQTRYFDHLPEGAAQKLQEGFFSNAFLAVNTDYACDQLMKAFDREKIEYMPFKGMLLRKYYPNPELRTMGDRDILIHHKDRLDSDKIIRSLDYQKYVDSHTVWTYYKNNLMFEIHDVLFYEDLANQIDYTEYFSHIWEKSLSSHGEDTSFAVTPDPDMHFLYCMAHTAKHIINHGVGFRAFLDMAFFVKNAAAVHDSPDWDWIRKELTDLKLFDFTKTCFSLCRDWFDIDMPFLQDEIDQDFVQEVTEKVFKDGVFGINNKDNVASGSAKSIHRSKHGYLRTTVGMTIHKLFPPYKNMQVTSGYKWVDGKPYLLPVAWVYRWIYCFIEKRKDSKDSLLEPYAKKGIIAAREKYLNRWNL